MEECFFEVVLYDAKHWWSIIDMFDPLPRQGLGIRYDMDYYVVWTHDKLHKVKVKTLSERIVWSEKKPISCKGNLVGKVYLDNCLRYGEKFHDGKEFLKRFVGVVSGVKDGKRDQGHRGAEWYFG
jgi:hypothetical protein